MNTNPTTLGSAVVTTAGATGNSVLTADTLQNMVFLGVTLGGWLYILTFISVVIIIILNSSKLWKNHLSKLFTEEETPTSSTPVKSEGTKIKEL